MNTKDVKTVVNFVIGWFPSYKDAPSWDHDLKLEDYEWGQAALRLQKELQRSPTEGEK